MKPLVQIIFSCALLLLSVSANADAGPFNVLEQVETCSAITADQDRLACFDSLSKQIVVLKAKSTEESIGIANVAPAPEQTETMWTN